MQIQLPTDFFRARFFCLARGAAAHSTEPVKTAPEFRALLHEYFMNKLNEYFRLSLAQIIIKEAVSWSAYSHRLLGTKSAKRLIM